MENQYSSWLSGLMARHDVSQYALAHRSKVPQPTIQRILSGQTKNPKADTLNRLAQALGERYSPDLRSLGAGQRQGLENDPAQANIEPGPAVRGVVPVISWVTAGRLEEAMDLHEPGVADDWQETTAPIRDHTFALRVVGDSMEPEFTAGTTIIVEPELSPENGDYVVVRNGAGEATFKQLVRDGDDWHLKPLNPRYPIKQMRDGCVVGVVIAQEKRYR